MKPKHKRFLKRQEVRVARYERKAKRFRLLAKAKENMAVKLITPNEFVGKPDEPVATPQLKTEEVKVEQAPAQPVQLKEEPYRGFVDKVKTGEKVQVSIS